MTKMFRPLLVAMVLLCSTLGLAQANGSKSKSDTTEVQSLPLTGGTMTGPIVGNDSFTSGGLNYTGGIDILDSSGNSIQTGHAGSEFGNVILWRTPGGAHVYISDTETGAAQVVDDAGNGLYAFQGSAFLSGGGAGDGNIINVDSLGFSMMKRGQSIGLPAYANNAAAVAGGLTSGYLYRTGTNPDVVCVVH